mmetsp:Transcript_82487/g.256510  ORF Transcript_82487/g.256510 Transcript_82487/m.256510 type:complete len:387 (-) Transcript_82487:432-1592(-)
MPAPAPGAMAEQGGGVGSPPWTPHRLVPEAERWRRTQETHNRLRRAAEALEASRDAERRKRGELEISAASEVDSWKRTARQMEIERDTAERVARTTAEEALQKVHSSSWAHTQQAAEYEDRIRALEALLAEERRAHGEELQRHADLVRQAQEDADARVQEVRQQCDAAVAAAARRAEEAEGEAEAARARAEEAVAATRRREDFRVLEVRHFAGHCVRESEEHRQAEVEQLRQRMNEHRQAMEEHKRGSERVKAEVLAAADGHLAAATREAEHWREVQEADLAMRGERLKDWRAGQKAQNTAVAAHHRGLLDMEKTLHGRTMERTMGRVARHMKLGSGLAETPRLDGYAGAGARRHGRAGRRRGLAAVDAAPARAGGRALAPHAGDA